MVVAAVIGVGEMALAVDGASEFAAPDDQRVVQQTALSCRSISPAPPMPGLCAFAYAAQGRAADRLC